jgi:hypothetical protein
MGWWSIEDIEALNSEDDQRNFLKHILHIGAASEKHLCEATESLEQLGNTFVIGLAQLPFLVQCGETFYRTPAWRDGLFVDLVLTPIRVAFTQTGELIQLSSDSADDAQKYTEAAWITQVTAIIRLWGERARLQRKYLNCISYTGFRNEIIGRVESWMDLPEARMSLPARRHAPLNAKMFEHEDDCWLQSFILLVYREDGDLFCSHSFAVVLKWKSTHY